MFLDWCVFTLYGRHRVGSRLGGWHSSHWKKEHTPQRVMCKLQSPLCYTVFCFIASLSPMCSSVCTMLYTMLYTSMILYTVQTCKTISFCRWAYGVVLWEILTYGEQPPIQLAPCVCAAVLGWHVHDLLHL